MGNCSGKKAQKQRKISIDLNKTDINQNTQPQPQKTNSQNNVIINNNNIPPTPPYSQKNLDIPINTNIPYEQQLKNLEKNPRVYDPLKKQFGFKSIEDISDFNYEKLEKMHDFLFEQKEYLEALLFGKKALARKIRYVGKDSKEIHDNHYKLSLTYQQLGVVDLAIKHLLIVTNMGKGQKIEKQEIIANQLQGLLLKSKFMYLQESCSTLYSAKNTIKKPSSQIQISEISVTNQNQNQSDNQVYNRNNSNNNKICCICQKSQYRQSQISTAALQQQQGQSSSKSNNNSNNYIFTLRCKHAFHFSCFLMNIQQQLECPQCRQLGDQNTPEGVMKQSQQRQQRYSDNI